MTMLSELIEQRLATLDPERVYRERVCLKQVSKDLHGVIRQGRQERQPCQDPGCLTLKIKAKLAADAVPHECDEVKELDGRVSAKLVLVFEESERRRGLLIGQLRWQTSAGLVLDGTISGIVNAGTHRPPAADCERCDTPGRVTGMIEATVRNGGKLEKECVLIASYALRLDPDAAGQPPSIRFDGALEGLLICPCRDPGLP